MAVADLTINVAVKTYQGAAGTMKFFIKTFDALSTTVRRTMRTFRDFVIVGYGLRRGFELLSRLIKSTFANAGGFGVRQLELLGLAWDNLKGRVGETIQRTSAYQTAIKGLTDAFRSSLGSEKSKDDLAKSIDRVIGHALKGVGEIANGFQQFFLDIKFELQEIQDKFGWFWGVQSKAPVMPTAPDVPNYLNYQEVMAGKAKYRFNNPFANPGPHDTLDINESRVGMERLQHELFVAQMQAIRNPRPEKASAGNALISAGDALIGSAGQGKQKAATAYGETQIAKFEEHIAKLKEDIEGLGDAWVGVFNTFGEESFDKSVGWKKAFKNIGKNAGKTFVQQMSNAMFSPMQQVFNELANLAAIPFRAIGHVLADLIVQPISDLITKLLPKAVSEMLTSQSTVAAAGAANQAAAGAGAAATAQEVTAANAPAAAAAGIGSWGTALIFGGIALAIIAAASARFMAEGGVVMPRAGGVPAILGEGGQPEVVLPLSKAPEILGAAGGGGRMTFNFIGGAMDSYTRTRSLARSLGRQISNEVRSGSYGRRRDRRG